MSALVAGSQRFFDQPGLPTHLVLFITVPILFFALLFVSSRSFRAFATGISLPLITLSHLWRFVGVVFILAFLLGDLAQQFALPAGIGDLIVATTAIPLSRALSRRKPVQNWFIAWNVFGLIDLLAAIALGVLYSEAPLGILRTDKSTAFMTSYPMSMIPTFFVPLFILLHLLTLLRSHEVEGRRAPHLRNQEDL